MTARRLHRLAGAEWDAGAFAEALHHLDQAADLADVSLDERLLVIQYRLLLQNRAERYDRIAADLAEVQAVAARTGHPRAVALAYWPGWTWPPRRAPAPIPTTGSRPPSRRLMRWAIPCWPPGCSAPGRWRRWLAASTPKRSGGPRRACG